MCNIRNLFSAYSLLYLIWTFCCINYLLIITIYLNMKVFMCKLEKNCYIYGEKM